MRGDRLHGVGNLRDEDHVGATGDTGGQRDVPGVAAHHFEDHDAVVARRQYWVESLARGVREAQLP